jgi:hypothetical protein
MYVFCFHGAGENPIFELSDLLSQQTPPTFLSLICISLISLTLTFSSRVVEVIRKREPSSSVTAAATDNIFGFGQFKHEWLRL